MAFGAGTPWNWQPGTATGSSYSPRHRYVEFYRSHGDSIVPLLEVHNLDQASAGLARGSAQPLRRGGVSHSAIN